MYDNAAEEIDESYEELTEEEQKLQEELMLKTVQAIGRSLIPKRERAVTFRTASGVERRWGEDQKLFEGIDPSAPLESMLSYATQEASSPPTSSTMPRSQVVMNIVRGKCEIAEGRFADIQLPVNDKNWGLKVTPQPTLVKAFDDDSQAELKESGQKLVDQEGVPLTVKDIADREMEVAKKKMKRMTTVIDDQLTECEYNSECRKIIESAVRLGTGILKGPNVVKRVKKAWITDESGRSSLRIVEEMKPESKFVPVWNIFPDPECDENIKHASYLWEKDLILKRDLEVLCEPELGYIPTQVKRVLEEVPTRLQVGLNPNDKTQMAAMPTITESSLYERWTYYGDISKQELIDAGLEDELPEDEDDILKTFSACVVFINEHPIKICLNPLDTGDMPFDFFQWTTVSGTPWGVGVARILTWPQRVITAGWRAMLDNAGDSAGANIIIGPGVEPDDGNYVITGKKLWHSVDDDIDVNRAFAQFQIDNHQVEYQSLIEFAMRFADIETSIPMLFQGESRTMPETLGATNIIVDSNNVALRGRVKRYDDRITVPHLKRYYDWNMQHSEDSDIKGDFNVDPKGASVLFEKDQQAQTLLSVVMQAKNDPDVNLRVDWDKAVVQLFNNLRLDNILKSDAEYQKAKQKYEEQLSQGPQDPKIIGAQIRAEGDLKKEQLRQQSDMAELQAKGEIQNSELSFKAQLTERQMQHEMSMKQMEMNIQMMKFANDRNISLDDIKAKLSIKSAELKTQKQLSQSGTKPAPQVTEPPVEPPKRAKDGFAYQQ